MNAGSQPHTCENPLVYPYIAKQEAFYVIHFSPREAVFLTREKLHMLLAEINNALEIEVWK